MHTFSAGIDAVAGRLSRASAARKPARGATRSGGRTASARARDTPTALEPDLAAWLAILPTTVLLLPAMVLLAKPLGALALPVAQLHFFADIEVAVRPEPTEQARYLIALTAPLLHLGFTLLLLRRPPRPLVASAARLAILLETLLVAAIAIFFVVQRTTNTDFGRSVGRPVVYFTMPTVIVAAAIAGAIVAAARTPRLRTRAAAWTAHRPGRTAAALLAALLAIAITLLPAIETDHSIGNSIQAVHFHLRFTYDETMAVVNGRSPIGDFATQYAALWPYLLAAGMSLLGTSLVAFTGLMTLLNAVTLLALYDVLRRVTRSSIAGLLLFLPLLATSAYRLHGPAVERFSLANYFGVLPLRYAGPLLLAWLVARHLDGARPRRAWPLFLVGGLVVVNNPDFGFAALGATVAALLWTRPRERSPSTLVLEATLALAAAIGLVTALLLVRTGSPPHFELLFSYAKVYIRGGFGMLPIQPVVGLSTIIFLTYAAAIGTGTVRALRKDPDRLLTGLLVWSGVFGLGSASYYVGHSLPELVTYLFPIWAFALTLLTVVTLRRLLAALPERRPTSGELACLFGFGLLVCSLAQTPAPWSQVDRISADGQQLFASPVGKEFVRRHTRPGEPVIVFTVLGHRLAELVGVDDVEPRTGSRSTQAVEQLDESLAVLKEAGGNKVFVWPGDSYQAQLVALNRSFKLVAVNPRGMQMWVRR